MLKEQGHVAPTSGSFLLSKKSEVKSFHDLFKKYNPKAILHNYKKNYSKNTYKLSKNPIIYLGSEIYDWCQNSINKSHKPH